MEDKFKITKEEQDLIDSRLDRIFQLVKARRITEDEAVEKIQTELFDVYESRVKEQSDKEYTEYIEKHEGTKLSHYNPETVLPIFE